MRRDTELRQLGLLCRALAARGVSVQIRDAIPGLTITRPGGTASEVIAYIVIKRNTSQFTWWRVDAVHPVADVDGTAELSPLGWRLRRIRTARGRREVGT